jgi:hypothetical protein
MKATLERELPSTVTMDYFYKNYSLGTLGIIVSELYNGQIVMLAEGSVVSLSEPGNVWVYADAFPNNLQVNVLNSGTKVILTQE